MSLRQSDVQKVQARAIYNEISQVARLGPQRVDAEEIPILKLIYLRAPKHFREDLVDLLGRAIGKIPVEPHRIAARMLFGLSPTNKNGSSAEDRVTAAADKLGVEVDAFRKTWRSKLLTAIAGHIASEQDWISLRQAHAREAHGFGGHINAKLIAGSPRIEEFVADQPTRLRTDYHYRVEIDAESGNTVQTSYTSRRLLADVSAYAVYICRNYDGIAGVIADQTIVGLEVAEIDPALWRDSCRNFAASLAIGGRHDATVSPDHMEFTDDWVRFNFARPTLPQDLTAPIALTILTSYRLAPDARRFPIKFANHFTVGGLRVDLMIRSQAPVSLSHAEYIAGLHAGTPIPKGLVYERARTPQARSVEASVALGPDVLVWPGSGIEFFWTIG